jgi:hypothetical protein
MWVVPCDFAFDIRTTSDPTKPSTERRACSEEFRSASIDEVIATQMKLAGWRSRATTHGVQWFCKHHARRIGKLAKTAHESEVSP